ncbi:MAG: hypothetical protein C0490_10785, partial [Marivirga sp.]|nr:hypothetical protein [Marivirga sp.]
MHRCQIILFLFFAIPSPAISQKKITLSSPSEKIKISLRVADSIYYSLEVNNHLVLSESTIALLTNQKNFGIKP